MSRTAGRYLAAFAVVACLAPTEPSHGVTRAVAGPPTRQLLVLQSYHQGDIVVRNAQRGLREAFERSGLRVSSSSSSWTRIGSLPTEASLIQFEQFLRVSTEETLSFDVLIASDDDALAFLRTKRDALFPRVPLVFMGVTDWPASMPQSEQSDITGIAGRADHLAAVKTALRTASERHQPGGHRR